MLSLTQSSIFIFLVILGFFLGFMTDIYLNLRMRRKFIFIYFFTLLAIALCSVSNIILISEHDYLKSYLESEFNFFISFNFKKGALFIFLNLFILWENFSQRNTIKRMNYFWIILLTYISLFADSYLVLIFCFESLAWLYFFENKESKGIEYITQLVHLTLGSLFAVLVFVEIINYGQSILSSSNNIVKLLNYTNFGQILKWMAIILIFVRSLSTLFCLKYEGTNKIYLFPYFLFVGLILGPFGNNIEIESTYFNLFMATTLYLISLFFDRGPKKRIVDVMHIPFLLGVSAFLMNVIEYDFFVLVTVWSFFVYYLYLNIEHSTFRKVCVLLLSLAPPSPLFFLVIKYLNSPTIGYLWTQCILFLLGFYSIHKMITYISVSDNSLNHQSPENVV